MPRQNRGYKRGEPYRDARLFVVICEGAKREKNYFEFFQQFSQRIKITVLPPENNASAPNHFLGRAQEYEEATGLNSSDRLWFVSDHDRWEEKVLREIATTCDETANWQLAISNPCFEVWLFLHFRNISDTQADSSGAFKRALDELSPSGYQVATFAPRIEEAIPRAKASDTNPNYFMPDLPGTKVYQLAEQMLEYLGQEWERAKHNWTRH